MSLPGYLTKWFTNRSWTIHDYQQQMFQYFQDKQSVLLVAPTGGGKTLASFLPALNDITNLQPKGLHTLYISPLKALTHDIHRNLLAPISEMNLPITVEIRTGDTSTYKRQRQIKRPPNILLTTPESLLLLLSYTNAALFFSSVKLIIIDELHSLFATKRGDLLSLALAELSAYAPSSIRFGLSATVAKPKIMAKWLAKKAAVISVSSTKPPDVSILTNNKLPYSGFMAKYAVTTIYEKIKEQRLTLVFVNTRAQTEFIFRQLWLINKDVLPIAIYHGSLSKEERLNTEALIVSGQIKAVVATSALELGIDWGNVDAVIQIGAPHAVSRLLQRIGRANHRFNQSSLAYLVPSNCFDVLEAHAAINAIAEGKLDDTEMNPGSLDVIIQFIINCACSHAVTSKKLFKVVRSAYPYRDLDLYVFEQLFQFAVNGGYVLQHYEQYNRLIEQKKEQFIPASAKVIRRHRQNIGTIIEAARLRVKILNKRSDKIVGDIEEQFIQELSPGDTFIFAGEVLEYVRLHDMFVETRKIQATTSKLPSYRGGFMPLSIFLANEVLDLLNHPKQWQTLPPKILEWLTLQQQFSVIPTKKMILVEQFPYKKRNHLVIYSFEGRKANNSLGMLATRHLERLNLKPISFTATDYGVAVTTFKPLADSVIRELFEAELLKAEFEDWLLESALLKRSFRHIAIITGLTERQLAGTRKSMKQVTFSTDLIYDVLKQHEPNHILLKITRADVEKILIDMDRLTNMLEHFNNRIQIMQLTRPSPFSVPILTTFTTEKIKGQAEEEILLQKEMEIIAETLIDEVRHDVH